MRVHLLRNEEVSEELFQEIVLFLQSFTGPVNFKAAGSLIGYNDEDLELEELDEKKFYKQARVYKSLECSSPTIPPRRLIVSWQEMFDRCDEYRLENDLGNDDFVLLLTDLANEHNWFSAL